MLYTKMCLVMALFLFILLKTQHVQYEDSRLASVVENSMPQSLQILPLPLSL